MPSNSTQLLLPEEAAQRLGLSASTLAKARMTGNGPRYIKLGARVLYRASDLDEFVEQRLCASTKDGEVIKRMTSA